MANEHPKPAKRLWLDCPVVATPDRLVIRPPAAYYAATGVFLLLSWLLPWLMVKLGLLDRAILPQLSLMMAGGILFFSVLLGRWWTLDRRADSVCYFPWRLCALSAVRGVRVVERRVGKKNLGRAHTVDLELEGGKQVRFAGFSYSRLGAPQALALAAILGEWLNVPVTRHDLTPTT
jgi:hypothetical protein